MGRLGFPVSQGDWVHKQNNHSELVIADETDPKQERTLDRVLAYTSFYVLLFAAFCAFLPAQTGTAFAYVKELNPIPALGTTNHDKLLRRPDNSSAAHENWQLRGSDD